MYNVVYCSNSKFLHFLTASIYSLLENNLTLKFTIHVLYSDINKKKLKFLKDLINKFGSSLVVYEIDENLLENVSFLNNNFSIISYYRLLIPDLINNGTVLYLDVDTIVLGGIEPLFNLSLVNHPIAAVKDFETIKHLDGMIPNKSNEYFNSGVMVLNLDLWRSEDLSKKILHFIKANPELIVFADQCGLNAIIISNWLKLDPGYNFQLGFFKKKILSNLNDNTIIHFTSSKSLSHFSNFNPFAIKIFFNYLHKSSFKYHFVFKLKFIFFKCLKSFKSNIKKLYFLINYEKNST